MYIFRLEASIEQGSFVCVLLAETEEQAFIHAEAHFEQTMPGQAVQELTLLEKKRCQIGSGYIIPSRDMNECFLTAT
ncbi:MULTISPECIES: DUF3906 family protein [unclassified Paenibacillus]|uniref:DUF3906 family protein n=1 Tax=unclassified Paenibacillus TaxID=185978 RepID=UPI0002F98E32|nr:MULTISPECIES: DUF3906 family protein [unclassified Paenibacillus]MCM3340390.1 DUF3906 family protein [Paenibacillus sp. MER TA 81-3]